MVDRRFVLLVAVATLVPALAGCADEAPAAGGPSVQPGSTTNGGGIDRPFDPGPAPTPKRTSERWHFHDHWKGQPTITLLNATVTLNATTGADGLPALSALVELPPGVIVPPETGQVAVTVAWTADAEGGLVNVTYRPADSPAFHPGGDLANGATATLGVTESMADVPHRARSLWAFNLTAKPDGVPPVLPPRDLLVTITATIGRPLFIDPPHVNWWAAGDVIPLVSGAEGAIDAARTPVANVSVPRLPGTGGGGGSASPSPSEVHEPVRVPVDAGRIVPEGTRTLVVSLNWSSGVPDQKLVVHYRERNLGTSGPLEIVHDGASSRVFALPVDPDQTDTTYSNRTTWEFLVLPEADPGAFHGTFTLYAWAARVAQDVAVRETVGTA